MKKFSASTTIHASPDIIWNILVDAPGYPDWDKTMKRIDGRIAPGEKVTFRTTLSDQAFPVKVTTFEPARKLVLTGGMPLGLFKSERTHALTPTPDGQTTFHTEEIFSGLLVPLFGRNLPDLTANFEGFVAALKAKSE